jgi:hypothetical protein
VQVHSLVGPGADAHVYQPTPADARTLSRARLVIVNGLGFEGWIDRLMKSSGYRGTLVVASQGVNALRQASPACPASTRRTITAYRRPRPARLAGSGQCTPLRRQHHRRTRRRRPAKPAASIRPTQPVWSKAMAPSTAKSAPPSGALPADRRKVVSFA